MPKRGAGEDDGGDGGDSGGDERKRQHTVDEVAAQLGRTDLAALPLETLERVGAGLTSAQIAKLAATSRALHARLSVTTASGQRIMVRALINEHKSLFGLKMVVLGMLPKEDWALRALSQGLREDVMRVWDPRPDSQFASIWKTTFLPPRWEWAERHIRSNAMDEIELVRWAYSHGWAKKRDVEDVMDQMYENALQNQVDESDDDDDDEMRPEVREAYREAAEEDVDNEGHLRIRALLAEGPAAILDELHLSDKQKWDFACYAYYDSHNRTLASLSYLALQKKCTEVASILVGSGGGPRFLFTNNVNAQ